MYGDIRHNYGCFAALLKNGDFFLVGGLDYDDTGLIEYWAARVDSAGNLLWQSKEKAFAYPKNSGYSCKGIELEDGSLVAIGNSFESAYKPALVNKFSPTGDLLWSQEVWGVNPRNIYIRDFSETHDGGFLICGSNHNPNQVSWVTRLDSNGCQTSSCLQLPLSQDFSSAELSVFPIPCIDQITFSYPIDFVFDKISITNLSGQTVLQFGFDRSVNPSGTLLDVSKLLPGVYFLHAGNLCKKIIKQ